MVIFGTIGISRKPLVVERKGAQFGIIPHKAYHLVTKSPKIFLAPWWENLELNRKYMFISKTVGRRAKRKPLVVERKGAQFGIIPHKAYHLVTKSRKKIFGPLVGKFGTKPEVSVYLKNRWL